MCEDGGVGLLYGLYLAIKQWKFKGLSQKPYKSQEAFLELLLPNYQSYGIKELHSHGEFTKQSKTDFAILKDIYENEDIKLGLERKATSKEERLKSIQKLIQLCAEKNDNASKQKDLKCLLIELLEKQTIHENGCERIREEVEKLIEFTINDHNYKEMVSYWTDVFYYFVYFAITDSLHPELAFANYPLREDLEEYNNKITMMYGASGNPGMYQLYAMANRRLPNIIALYECGEREYYGTGPSRAVSYENAYEYYSKTLECNKDHPLALWSIAYMQFKYLFCQSKKKEHQVEAIKQLKEKSESAIYESIIEKVGKAYLYNGNAKAAAANLLGKIMECSDQEFPYVYRGHFAEKEAREYYKQSAEYGYVYGCNNYAQICMKESRESDDNEYKIKKAKETIKFLKRSARQGEPWALNRYGLFLYDGWKIENEIIVGANEREAYKSFEYAMIMMRTQLYYWPLINMCNFFWLNSKSTKRKRTSTDIKNIIEQLNDALSYIEDKEQIVEIILLRKNALEILDEMEKMEIVKKWNYNQQCRENQKVDSLMSLGVFCKVYEQYLGEKKESIRKKIEKKADKIMLPEGVSSVISICYGNKNKTDFWQKYSNGEEELEDPIFDLASITKFFLALVYIKLEEEETSFEGKRIQLEKKIGDYTDKLFPNITELRICDMLSFNVHLETEFRLDKYELYKDAYCELMNIKGHYSEEQEYSDMPMLILAELLYTITGRNFQEWLAEFIIEPLKLENTFWNYNEEKSKQCIFYENEMKLLEDGEVIVKKNQRGVVNDSKASILSDSFKKLCGHAGLFSSAKDIAKIVKALLNEEIVSKKALLKMVIGNGWDKESINNSYGYGCCRKYKDKKQSEVPFILSPYTIVMSGYTGCYLAIDVLNEIYYFIGADRLSNCICSNKSKYIENNGYFEIRENRFRSSLNFVYERDELRDLLAEIVIFEHLNE